MAGTLTHVETMYSCNCKFAKDIGIADKKFITDENGKTKSVKIRKIISSVFDDHFNSTQFKWTQEMCNSRREKIDYHETYIINKMAAMKEFNATGTLEKFKELTSYNRVDDYVQTDLKF